MAALVIVGAVPATYMSFDAALLSLNGFMTFLSEGGWQNLLYGAWGLAGIVGALGRMRT